MKHVLILEDEHALQQAYRLVLETHGYSVATASNGAQGLERLQEQAPDLILLDMLMPVMDGLAFMQQARIEEQYPQTLVITFSNFSHSDKLDAMRAFKIYDQVLKADVSPAQLVRLVEKALAKPVAATD